ncbi:MAG: hypothetical protein Tsb0013_03780 [Phycisphaerales bacterium]
MDWTTVPEGIAAGCAASDMGAAYALLWARRRWGGRDRLHWGGGGWRLRVSRALIERRKAVRAPPEELSAPVIESETRTARGNDGEDTKRSGRVLTSDCQRWCALVRYGGDCV